MNPSPDETVRGGFGAQADEQTLPPAQPPVTLDRARRYFLESAQATRENDKLCERDAKYFHGDQLSAEVRAKLQQRGQPAIVINRIAPAINGILGLVDGSETSPECYPRSFEEQNAADVATKLLRYLGDRSDMGKIRRELSEDFFIYGTAAVLVGEGAHSGTDHIDVTRIAWEDFFYDPLSRTHDFSDARYLGVCKWMDADQLAALYPERYKELGNPFSSDSDFFSEKTSLIDQRLWVDRDRRRVRIVELYLRDEQGAWQRLVFCEAGYFEFGESAYSDDSNASICPIVAASYEINRLNGDRYGPIRHMVAPQDEMNSRRSMMLHRTLNRTVQQTEEGVDPTSKEIAKREAAKADGAIPYGFSPVAQPDVFQQNADLLQITSQEFDRLAPTAGVLSRFGAGDSGRARQILQQAGYTEWSRAFARMEALELSIFKRLWFCAKQFMNAPTWVRITNEARAAEFEQINVPKMGMVPTPVTDPTTGQPQVDPHTGQPMMQMKPGVVGVHNEVAKMDVDIILSTVPQTDTLEQEQIAEILRYAASTGISPFDPQFKMVMMLFPLQDKTKTLERWDAVRKEMQQEVAQQQQQQMQQQQQAVALQQMKIQSDAAKNTASAHKNEAEATAIDIQSHLAAHKHAMEVLQAQAGLQQQQAQTANAHISAASQAHDLIEKQKLAQLAQSMAGQSAPLLPQSPPQSPL